METILWSMRHVADPATSLVDADHLAAELTVSMSRNAHASSDEKSHCLDCRE